MTDSRLKSSILTNFNNSNLLPKTNTLLSSSSLLNTGLLSTNTERKTKSPVDASPLEIKKQKTENVSNKPLTLLSNLSSLSLSTKISLTSTAPNHSAGRPVLSLSKPNLLSSSLTTKNYVDPQPDIQSVKRSHEELDPIVQNGNDSFLQDEYLKTESLINQLNTELKGIEDEFKRTKRLKLTEKPKLIDNSQVISNQKLIAIKYKNCLINAVSSSLLREPNFKNQNDETRNLIMNLADSVTQYDPEFILKLALYTRRELNIRVTANFLLCLASNKEKTRPFLQKYFKNSIVLPSDWIDVAEQYQLFSDKRLNYGALPSALRKCMSEKFSDFDRYQLAKYNKEKSRLAKNKDLKDVKHVKSKLKDEKGNTTDIVEHKYITPINNGLKISDRILIELNYTEECKSIKFDIINRDVKVQENLRAFKKVNRKMPRKVVPDEKNELNDKIACRISVDFDYNRIVVKNLIEKEWSKRNDTFKISPDSFAPNTPVKLYIDVTSNKLTFGVIKENEQKILDYPHSKHNFELYKLNYFRISAPNMKLKNLKIFSTNQIAVDQDEESEATIKQRSFTLKQLIRQLHISNPVDNVMCLIGKKYPLTFEDFLKSKLPGIYDSERAGKRMKLEIPETWETQISLKGNKAEVWEQLIDNKKLPYMAMLRNLRNMIKTGISEKHHRWVLKKLQDEGAVVNSKQFPFRFFTAYEVLDELEEDYNNYIKWCENPIPKDIKKKKDTDVKYDTSLLKRYKIALDNALKVASTFNIPPIQGNTVIVLNLSQEMDIVPGRSAKSLGKRVTSISEMAALLALMFKYSCENSHLIIFAKECTYTNIELEQGTILDNMKSLIELKNATLLTKNDFGIPRQALLDLFLTNQTYDNLIYLSNGVKQVDFFKEFLRKYRADKNENLLFVNVNLATDTLMLARDPNFDHENDVNISGFSDAILRFVAERGNKGQLVHIENIDKSYELPEIKDSKKVEKINLVEKIEKPRLKLYVPKQEFKTLKVFISSTFRDMHSERDILTRTVFPLLRSKLSSLLINIYEIDLRWGITETEAESNQTLDLCLNQVLNSDYFINILGSRYGYVLDEYKVRKNSQLDWLNSHPPRASITELEIETQLKKVAGMDNKYETTFFYFRDSSFINHVPGHCQSHFIDENEESTQKLMRLKSKLRNSNYEIFDGYTCKWLKFEEYSNKNGRALLTGLDSFAHRVFSNLFNSISRHHKNDVSMIQLDEINHFNNLTHAYIKLNCESFVGRDKLLSKFEKTLNTMSYPFVVKVLLLEGEAGSGKTSFMSHYLTNYKLSDHKFVHMIGAYPGSEFISQFLKRFCISINRIYNFGMSEDDLENGDYLFYKTVFEKFLTKISTEVLKIDQKFFIIIDGVDNFVDDNKNVDYSFDWLPESVQSNILFVFSTRSDSPTQSDLTKISYNNTRVCKLKIETFEIENLDILDKSEFIKSKLAKYNKYLDENPFNNQIKMLTTKRDSSNPLYLSLVCEELRNHNFYETLNQKLKDIPIRINQLLAFVLERLERDYGQEFVTIALNFICASRDGLNEQELKLMISLFFKIKSVGLIENLNTASSIFNMDKSFYEKIKNTRVDVPVTRFLSFIETISETFLKPRSKTDQSLIQIRSNQYIENVLRTTYGTKSNITPKLTNKIMSIHYWSVIENNFDKKWTNLTRNERGFIYLPYHLVQAELFNDLSSLLTNILFLSTKCELGLIGEIMSDFDLHQDFKVINILTKVSGLKKSGQKIDQDITTSKIFSDYRSFIQSNYHLFCKNSTLFFQQIMNQPEDSLVLNDLKNFLLNQPNFSIGYFAEWLNKSKQSDSYKIHAITIKDFDESISSVSISPDGSQVACGTKNCQIKLYSVNSAKFIRNFQGHSGNINSVKFVSNDILCSTSSDGKACLWSVNGGFRIKVLDKHNGHNVKDCCADSNGKTLITVGWDCGAKIWNPTNGSLEGELAGHPRPVNCVCFNPEGTMVATGCWDSCIRIFNLYDRVRKGVLRGHKTSVRSIGFSINGVYIASASIDGEVKLWNSRYGSQIGTLKGHSMPVNSISFSPISQYLITGSSDRRLKVWSGTIGKMIRVIDSQSKKPLTSVSFYQKTGEIFSVGSHEGYIFVYEIHGILRHKIKVHDAFVTRIKFNNEGTHIISACDEGKVFVTNISNPELVSKSAELKGNTCSVKALAVNNLNVIITGSDDCSLRVYPYILDKIKENGFIKEDPTYELKSHVSPITAISFNSSGEKFASASKDALIIVWSMYHVNFEVTELFRISNAHLDWITDLEWSNSSDFILTSSNDNTLKIWNGENGKEKCVLTGHLSNINSCSFQYGCAISTSFDGSIKVWSHKGHEISTLLGHQGRVNSCDLFVKTRLKDPLKTKEENPKDEKMNLAPLWGEEVQKEQWLENHKKKVLNKQNAEVEEVYLISCSDDSTIRVWKPIESDYLLSLENHNNSINSVDIDKNYLISTASSDKTVNLWKSKNFFDSVNSGQVLNQNGPTKTHSSEVTCICFDQDKQFILSGSFDGTIIMWKILYTVQQDANGNERKLCSNIQYVQELHAHEKTCGSICIISESSEEIYFVTCSRDRSMKTWKINKRNENASIELVQRLGSNEFLYAAILETSKEKFLISVQLESYKLLIRKNKISKNKIELSNAGYSTINFTSIIHNLRILGNKLYITVPHDEIFVLEINPDIKKIDLINFSNVKESDKKNISIITSDSDKASRNDYKSEGSESSWYCSMGIENDHLFVGDAKGDLYCKSITNLEKIKKIHESKVTNIMSFENKNGSKRFVSSGQDGILKFWSHNFETQIGQFNNSSGITVIEKLVINEETIFVFGDQMGNLNLVKWYD